MKIVATAILLLCTAACVGQNRDEIATAADNSASSLLLTRVEEIAPASLAANDVPSVAVAYLADGKIQWTVAFGERAPGEAATPDTLYNVASVTKSVTAETMLRLAADGRIDLDAAMAPIFIDADLAGEPRAKLLTPRMALSHRTGFAENWRRDMDGGKLAISRDPGTRARYSGENPTYVAAFASAKMSQEFDALAAKYVFRPAGMTDTYFVPGPSLDHRIAMVRGPDGTLAMPDRSSSPSAADNIHTSVADFARFVSFAMNGEALPKELWQERAKIYDDQVEQACPPGIIPPEMCAEHTGFGLGWMVFDSGDNRFLLHNGKDWGERAIAVFEPQKKYGAVVFTSGANGRSVISDVLQVLLPDAKLNTLIAAEAEFEKSQRRSD